MNKINPKSLLSPISPEAPSGKASLEYDLEFSKLEGKIIPTPAREYDGKIVQEAKEPNWREAQEDAVNLLTNCHDLRVTMILTQTLLHTDGIHGLAMGLELLHGFISQYWESLYPQLDPEDNNDPFQRFNILASLSEGQEILSPLNEVTICVSPKAGTYTCRDILIASGKLTAPRNDKKHLPNANQVDAAFKDTDVEMLTAHKIAIEKSIQSLTLLNTQLKEKVGSVHFAGLPDFSRLHDILSWIDTTIEKHLKDQKDMESPDIGPKKKWIKNIKGKVRSSETSFIPDNFTDDINGRQDVIRLLDRICAYYENNEPGSPIPLLLNRARRLVESNFIEILQDLAPDSAGKIKDLIIGSDKKT